MNQHKPTQDSEWIEPREWFYSHLPAPFPFPSLRPEETSANANFIRNLHPFTAEYYQKLIPIFSSFITEKTEMNTYDSLFLRDGIIGLLQFILKNQNIIKNSPTRFLIHQSLAPFLPTELIDSFSFYSLHSTPLKKTEKKRLLLAGTFFNEHLNKPYIERVLSKLRTQVPTNCSIDIYFSTGNSGQNPKQIIDTFKTIEKILGPIERQLEWKQVYFQRFLPESFTDCYFFELNPKFYYADSFVSHYFLKKGAELLKLSPQTQADFVLELSPWHSFQLWDKLPEAGTKFEFIKEHWSILNVLQNNKDERPVLGLPPLTYPWNSDFALYLQEMFTEEALIEDC